MLLRLIAYLVVLVAVVLLPGGGLGFLLIRHYRVKVKAWRAHRLAKEHSQDVAAASFGIQCCFCYHQCNAERDCYDNTRGWYHDKCLQALYG